MEVSGWDISKTDNRFLKKTTLLMTVHCRKSVNGRRMGLRLSGHEYLKSVYLQMFCLQCLSNT